MLQDMRSLLICKPLSIAGTEPDKDKDLYPLYSYQETSIEHSQILRPLISDQSSLAYILSCKLSQQLAASYKNIRAVKNLSKRDHLRSLTFPQIFYLRFKLFSRFPTCVFIQRVQSISKGRRRACIRWSWLGRRITRRRP